MPFFLIERVISIIPDIVMTISITATTGSSSTTTTATTIVCHLRSTLRKGVKVEEDEEKQGQSYCENQTGDVA